MWAKNCSKAYSPPADPPMPTMRNLGFGEPRVRLLRDAAPDAALSDFLAVFLDEARFKISLLATWQVTASYLIYGKEQKPLCSKKQLTGILMKSKEKSRRILSPVQAKIDKR
jgi:hypothetical protein